MGETKILRPIRHEVVDLGDGKGRVHHLVVFEKPFSYLVNTRNVLCSLFNWTPRHGGVRNWKWLQPGDCKGLKGREIGLLVPRICWNIWWRRKKEQEKLNVFALEAVPYEGPVPYYD